MTIDTSQSMLGASTTNATSSRIVGYDIARGLAFIGMVIVNFKLVMGASEVGPAWFVWFIGLLEGRAVATFVMLAGVGISLLSQRARASGDSAKIAQVRTTLLKRAAFLFVFGLMFATVWPPDILHFYGVYIALGALLLLVSDRLLWATSAGFVVSFVGLLGLFDYDQGWNFETFDYLDFWTVPGMIRHIFFNGFHPVFPWTAFLFIGMWLGRQNVHDRHWRRPILVLSLTVALITETLSWLLVRMATAVEGMDTELATALFGTEMIPPMPLYMVAAGATALTIILLCVMLTDRDDGPTWWQPLIATGQLALTLYAAHIIIGMGILEGMGRLEHQSLRFAVGSAVTFSVLAIIFSTLWRRYFRHGPLEWVMRQL